MRTTEFARVSNMNAFILPLVLVDKYQHIQSLAPSSYSLYLYTVPRLISRVCQRVVKFGNILQKVMLL